MKLSRFAPACLFAACSGEQYGITPATRYHSWIHKFASIGDSYAAGLGAGDRIDWSCSRYAHSYPHLLHTSLLHNETERTHQFLACTGATSSEILQKQMPLLDSNIDLLTISAGGNDIGLTPVLSDCIYQFYLAGDDDCAKAIANAKRTIDDTSQLYRNMTHLLEAAQTKLSDHGVIYVTGYASFFGANDHLCDNITWAVWSNLESQKQYLTLELRQQLNALVTSVNDVLRTAVRDFSLPSSRIDGGREVDVRFVDYDASIQALRGRYCEAGIPEPAPSRADLAFYEWDTVDKGENATQLLNVTGDDVPRGSFEAEIAVLINRTLEEHPGWDFERGKGFINKTKSETMSGEKDKGGVGADGALGDTIHWLLPDAWKRVFHLRPRGHEVVARMILEDLGRLTRERERGSRTWWSPGSSKVDRCLSAMGPRQDYLTWERSDCHPALAFMSCFFTSWKRECFEEAIGGYTPWKSCT